MEPTSRGKKIKLLLLDVDGVLTDGRLYFGPSGEEMKVLHVRDGYGLKLWHDAGFRSGIISRRNSDIVSRRASQLGMHFVYQGNDDKPSALAEIATEAHVSRDEIAFVGDDLLDVPVLEQVGLAVAVADAVEAVKQAAHYVTKVEGGRGAVREVIDMLLALKSE